MTGFSKRKVQIRFSKKILIFRGIAKSSQLAVEIDSNTAVSQNVQKQGFPKKFDISRKKTPEMFQNH